MYKQGDIIVVHFPFSDNIKKSKMRPAIVISNEISNNIDHDLIICPITTMLRRSVFSFLLDNGDLHEPLPQNSEVRCNKIATIRSNLVLSKISELSKDKMDDLIGLVKRAF